MNLKELGIDEANFDELQELFKMFDNDKDGVLSLKEFEKILSVLGRSGGIFDVMTNEHYLLSSASITAKHLHTNVRMQLVSDSLNHFSI